jgi:DNA-binding transcriptional LysR family regulator
MVNLDLDTLDLRKLRAFYLVARHGSLRHAAAQLHVTVSAVSVSIRRLEIQLGRTLFKRMPNKLLLTVAGERLRQSAEVIFEGIEKALADSALEEPRGRLSVSVSSDLAWYFIPKITEFLKRYREIELGIYINSSPRTLHLLERGKIDIGFGRFRKVPNGIESKPIVSSSISLVCTPDHPLARRRVPKLEDMARNTLITLPAWQSTRQMIDIAFARAKVRLGSHIEAGTCQTISDLVEAGIGVGLVHTFCTHRHKSANLRCLNMGRYFDELTFSAVYPKHTGKSPMVFKLLNECVWTFMRQRVSRRQSLPKL